MFPICSKFSFLLKVGVLRGSKPLPGLIYSLTSRPAIPDSAFHRKSSPSPAGIDWLYRSGFGFYDGANSFWSCVKVSRFETRKTYGVD